MTTTSAKAQFKFNVDKVLLWTVKIASMIVCAPTTWTVAGEAMGQNVLIQLSGVLLVEGVLLSNWTALERDRTADPAVKSRYALTALVMYGAIVVLSMHEGWDGAIFRVALGAALIGSMWDTIVDTWKSAVKVEARDITKSFDVSRHAAKVAKLDAKAEIDRKFAVRAAERRAELDIEMARIADMRRTELDKFAPPEPSVPAVPSEPVLPRPADRPINKRPSWTPKKLSISATDDDLLDIYRDYPHFSVRDTEAELKRRGKQMGKSTISKRLKELEALEKVHVNGQVTVLS